MSRRTLINLLLFLAVGLLGLLTWRLQPQPLPALTELHPEQIKQIVIKDRAGREIRLTRQSGGWLVNGSPADTERIDQLLGLCHTPSLKRFPAPADNLQQFGLAPPMILLQLNDLILAFGSTDPVQGWRYVRIDNQIHLIGDGFHHHLTAAPSEYRAEQ
ncbi:MAG: hypothetical protein QNJ78_07250 [Gammaproteobacteria bacterium]|nr:hypothetical protein [Gammaproteobacteria bacterium]